MATTLFILDSFNRLIILGLLLFLPSSINKLKKNILVLKLISFYKYSEIQNPEETKNHLLTYCNYQNLKGKIYVASEGLNGNVCGEVANIELFKVFIKHMLGFEDTLFKEDEIDTLVFSAMHVRVKKELVNLGIPGLTNKNGGTRLSPEKLLEFYESGKDFVIIDTRNSYESKIGHFKNSINPEMKNFREWKNVAESLQDYKDKAVVTYCTGGIRCEKASAYLVELGFKDVYQLDGGILTFIKKFPDTYWEGGMFVFDGRKVVNPNSKEELKYTSTCEHCAKPTSYYINCHNLDCDKLLVCCKECAIEKNYCCSESCVQSSNKRSKIYE